MTTENHTKSTEILGKLLGREEIAQAQNKTYKEALDHVFNIIDKLPPEQKGAKTLHGNCQQRCSSLRKLLQQRCSLGSILKKSPSSQPCRELSAAIFAFGQRVCDFSKPEIHLPRRKHLAQ